VGLYRDKRRQNFNRRMAALLLALLGGMAAKRIYGLTFGSFEEYLGAFAWGVGVSVGFDPVVAATSGTLDQLRSTVNGLLSWRPTSQPASKPDGAGAAPETDKS